MKQLFSLTLLCLWLTSALGQKDIPAFGTLDKADLAMKECVFEENAAAMVLAEEGKLKFEPDNNFFKMVLDVRVRIKVFTEKGLSYADIRIPYLSDDRYERITDVQGYTYNIGPDGEVEKIKLEKSQIFNQKVTGEFSEVKFSLPQVKTGSVFEYRYRLTRQSFSRIKPWYFQRSIPIRLNRFSIDLPEYFRVTPRLQSYEQVDKKQEEFSERMYTPAGGVNVFVEGRAVYVGH
jgi:Domain of Unknown Function with PDB structure (DUF3857)